VVRVTPKGHLQVSSADRRNRRRQPRYDE
jgi:hypothetical protein